MEDRTVKVGIRHDMMEAGDQHKKRTGRGWENKQLTVKQLITEKELNGHLFTRPARQVGSILRLVCLKQELVKANKGGNKGGATYRIEPLQYELIMDIIRRRAKKKDDKLKLKNELK